MSKPLTVTLRNGRVYGYREYGNTSSGFPVLFFHGNLNSRLFQPAWAKSQTQTEQANVRVIAIDRPGYGLSSMHPGRTYADFATDMDEFADQLDISKFGVVGYSSGGPHALACACGIAHRVTSCALVSSDAPYRMLGEELEKKVYGGLVDHKDPVKRIVPYVEELRQSYQGIGNAEKREIALNDLEEATRQGLLGAAWDGVMETSDWKGIWDKRDSVTVPLLFWHGSDDHDVPPECCNFLSESFSPQVVAAVNIIEGENHTLIRRHWQTILQQVVQQSRRAAMGRRSRV